MSEEELRETVSTHEGLAEDERRILSEVFSTSQRLVAEVMRLRGQVAFLAQDLSLAEAAQQIVTNPFSRYPVTDAGFDDVVGFSRA